MDARVGVPALLVGIGLLTGCFPGHTTAAPVRATDPAYAINQLRHAAEGDYGVLPATLTEALPNHRIRLSGSHDSAAFSDALVTGTVSAVTEGNGVNWGEQGHPVVGYDDPRADTRTVVVTMTTDDAVGRVDPEVRSISFRVLVPPGAAPRRFVGSMAGLHRIAVLLDRDPTDHSGTPWRPIIDDKLIAVVAADGTITLPTFVRGRSFAGAVHTVDQLLAAARRPTWTTTVPRP